MSEFFKAELKDRFLEYAADRDDYFEVQLLYDEFLRPNYSLEYVHGLVTEIIDYDADLLDVMSGNGAKIFMLASTPSTADFMEEGGFTDLYIREEEKWDTFFEHLSNNRRLTNKEKAVMTDSKKASYKKERRLLFLLIFAVAFSFLFALSSILKNSFFEDDYITKEEFEKRLKDLEENQSRGENLTLSEEKLDSADTAFKKDSVPMVE
ncbi:hypothetical protein [Allomuricauda sp. SCSIO 65647]|uniref:hypothetical protein n=1 Tax=Allomuricauda sp. SCSIO 65647 TaxID=2908843 RepID=UPI001F245560|nr:hypothetical protein [Muricauda sp. SCSIO 65647]UJH66727.1 hypothetical protein L0P89_12250 [Muricauda sp. SCSIO 65647]